jgi:acyl-CoA thioesterase
MLDSFPGMYTSILPFKNFHENQPPIDRQSLYIYSANLDPTTTPDFNLEACAHLYHSDRESIWSVLRQFELLDVIEVASSLSHTVTFHVGAEKLRFFDEERKRRWYFLETSAKRVNDGRGLHEGRVYDREGNHVATTMQDGAIRLKWKDEEEKNARQDKIRNDSKLKLKL